MNARQIRQHLEDGLTWEEIEEMIASYEDWKSSPEYYEELAEIDAEQRMADYRSGGDVWRNEAGEYRFG